MKLIARVEQVDGEYRQRSICYDLGERQQNEPIKFSVVLSREIIQKTLLSSFLPPIYQF